MLYKKFKNILHHIKNWIKVICWGNITEHQSVREKATYIVFLADFDHVL